MCRNVLPKVRPKSVRSPEKSFARLHVKKCCPELAELLLVQLASCFCCSQTLLKASSTFLFKGCDGLGRIPTGWKKQSRWEVFMTGLTDFRLGFSAVQLPCTATGRCLLLILSVNKLSHPGMTGFSSSYRLQT